jgi:murein DD-endopeptidase MepM/ murein hydrolase activator NlpD
MLPLAAPLVVYFGALYALRTFLERSMHPVPKASDWIGWKWPVPSVNGRAPEVSDGYSRTLTLVHRKHLGVDIMFRRREGDPVGLPYSSKLYTSLGANTPIRAAGPGVIWDASNSARGYQVTIDHGKHLGGCTTYYQHLSRFSRAWQKGDRVEAGDQLGLMGGDVSTTANLHHLHFELLFPRAGTTRDAWTADPVPYLRFWSKGEGAT